MITINAHTKIAALLKAHPDALAAIVGISPAFSKLQNPLLRKLMAPRASIRVASKIGGCSIEDFFKVLEPLGFVIERIEEDSEKEEEVPVPDFIKNMKQEQLVRLDVRPMIEGGKDPLQAIMKQVRAMKPNQILQLCNTFEPVPLIELLKKQGFECYVETIDANTVLSYFYQPNSVPVPEQSTVTDNSDWDEILSKHEGNTVQIDVRDLEMPLPMLTILDALEKLDPGKILWVHHKRIPVFLLPELADRKFNYRIKTISDSEVHLLIFRQ